MKGWRVPGHIGRKCGWCRSIPGSSYVIAHTRNGSSGYTFGCPDMIGGGEFSSFLNHATIAQALIVRYALIHALAPMMQFSVAPWRMLDHAHPMRQRWRQARWRGLLYGRSVPELGQDVSAEFRWQ